MRAVHRDARDAPLGGTLSRINTGATTPRAPPSISHFSLSPVVLAPFSQWARYGGAGRLVIGYSMEAKIREKLLTFGIGFLCIGHHEGFNGVSACVCVCNPLLRTGR